jgi:Fe-S oxidoreductase
MNNIKIHKSFILQDMKNEIKESIINKYNKNQQKKDKIKMREEYINKTIKLREDLNDIINKLFINKDKNFINYTTKNYITILGYIIDDINETKELEYCLSVLDCDDNFNNEINNFDIVSFFTKQYEKEEEDNKYTNVYKDDKIDYWFNI